MLKLFLKVKKFRKKTLKVEKYQDINNTKIPKIHPVQVLSTLLIKTCTSITKLLNIQPQITSKSSPLSNKTCQHRNYFHPHPPKTSKLSFNSSKSFASSSLLVYLSIIFQPTLRFLSTVKNFLLNNFFFLSKFSRAMSLMNIFKPS